MPLASVVVVLTVVYWPDGSVLPRVIFLPESGVPLAVRVPLRVKDWLIAGVVVGVVMVIVVGVGVPTVSLTKALEGA